MTRLGHVLRGIAMGLADVVPGVSGGTIALTLGIHPRLVAALHAVDARLVRLLPGLAKTDGRQAFASAWRAKDLGFLVALGIGLLAGIFVGSRTLSILIDTQPTLMAAFFFGLILASSRVPWRMMDRRGAREAVAFIVAALLAAFITVARPIQAPEALWFLPVAGAIAVAAMLLPGVSGSFLLLIMGLYEPLLRAVGALDFVVILLFGAGAVVGILTAARVLHLLLVRYRDPTLAALTGLMLGSVGRVWPWRTDAGFAAGQPAAPTPGWGIAAAAAVAILGAGVVALLERADPAAKRH